MVLTFSLLTLNTSMAALAKSRAAVPTSAVSASAMGSFFFLRTSLPLAPGTRSAFFFSGTALPLLPDDDVAAAGAGHGTLDDEDVGVGIDADDLHVALGDGVGAHVAGRA